MIKKYKLEVVITYEKNNIEKNFNKKETQIENKKNENEYKFKEDLEFELAAEIRDKIHALEDDLLLVE